MQLEVTAEMVRLLERGERFAVATMVDAHGSTPQRVGARLLVRGDGTTSQYVPPEFPAVADPDLLAVLRSVADAEGIEHSVGVIRAHDAFYRESPWAHPGWEDAVRPWTERGVLAVENESSALFVVGHLRGVRAATCLIAAGNLVTGVDPTDDELERGLDDALTVVLGAARAMAERDG